MESLINNKKQNAAFYLDKYVEVYVFFVFYEDLFYYLLNILTNFEKIDCL